MLHVLTHLTFMTILEHTYDYSPHLRDKEGGVTERLSNLPSWRGKPQHQGPEPRQSGSSAKTPLS